MRVKVAGTAGFCWGVQRALRLLEAAGKDGGKTVTFGPLIHNAPVLGDLEGRGILPVESAEQASGGTRVAVRPHGILQAPLASLEGRGAEVLDLTCPHVDETRRRVYDLAERGMNIVIVGNRDHDEVQVLQEAAKTRCWVVGSAEEAQTVSAELPFAVVSQSTFGPVLFEDIEEALRERYRDIEVHRTFCGATEDRQEEAVALAAEADVLVVVGPYHSGNARRLAELSRESGKQTFHVEVPEDLPVGSLLEQARLARRHSLMERYAEDSDRLREASDPKAVDREVVIGVTAGASTPPWVLQVVVDHLLEGTGAELDRGLPKDLAAEAEAARVEAAGAPGPAGAPSGANSNLEE